MPSTPYSQYIFIGKDATAYAIEYFQAPGDTSATNLTTATLNTSLTLPRDLAADLPAGWIYVIAPSNYGDGSQSGRVIRLDTDTPNTAGVVVYQDADAGHSAGNHFDGVYALEIDTTNHYLYLATQTYNTPLTTFGADTGIIRLTYDPATGNVSNQTNIYLAPGNGPGATTNWIQSMSLDGANGKLFYVDNSLGRVVGTFPTPSNQVSVVDLSNNSATVLVKFNGGDTYLDASYNNGGILSVTADPTDHLVFFVSNGGTSAPSAAQNNLWVADDHTANQTPVKLTESLTYDSLAPYEISFDDVHNFLYVDYFNNNPGGGGVLVRYDVTGTTTANIVLSNATVISTTGSGTKSAESAGFVDQLPVLTLTGSSTTALNDGAAITLTSGTPTITDSDGSHLKSATVQITSGTFAGSTATDHLTISGSASGTSGAISWSYTSGTETLTLTGYDTFANYQSLLALVKYNATGDATNGGANTSRTVTWIASDGALGNPAGTNSTTTTFNVTANTPPVAANVGPFSINEDQTTPRIAVTLSATDADSGDAVQSFTIASLPAHGRLFTASSGGTQLAVSSTVAATGGPTYTATIWFELVNPTDNDFNGNTTFTYTAFDGDDNSAAATATISVTSINDAPTAVNSSATFNEDTTHTFTAAEFQFTDTHDSPANALASIIITSLPVNGLLKFNGTTIVSGDLPDSILKTDIDAGKLTFVPAANANGATYATFGFKVQDNGGTTGTGAADTSTNTATFTLNVNSVSDAPTGADNTVSSPAATLYVFQVTDFTVNDPNDTPADTLNRVQITGLPSYGTLKNGATTLGVNDFVTLADIQNGLFKFDPGAGTGTATFQFKVEDTGSTNNGGVILSAASNTMSIAVDEPPTIANLGGDSTTFVEGGTPLLLDQTPAAVVADTDSSDFNGGNLTVAIASGGTAGEDVLSIVTNANIVLSSSTVQYDADGAGGNAPVTIGTVAGGTGGTPLVVTFTTADATPDAVSALIAAIAYQNTNLTDPSGTDRVVRFTVNDGDGATSANSDVTVHVTPVNDEPTLTATAVNPTFIEGDASPADIFQSPIVASTIEASQTFSGMTVTITNVTDGANEEFTFDGQQVQLVAGSVVTGAHGIGLIVDFDGASTITLHFSGASLTAAQLQNLIDGFAYRNNSQDPTAADRVVTITQVVDSGGNTPPDDSTTDLTGVTSTVTVVAVNDEPTLTATAVTPTFTEGDASPADIFSSPVASTIEAGQTFTSMTLTVTNVTDGASELLGFDGSTLQLTNGFAATTATNSLNASVSLSGSTATVTFSGATLSASALQTLIDALSYSNTSQDPSGADRVVTITQLVDSGPGTTPDDNTSTPNVTSTVHVTPVNDEPTLTATATNPTYHENDAPSALFSGAAASTIEAAQTIASIKLTVSGLADGAGEHLSIDGADVQLTNGFSVASTHGAVNVTVAASTATVTLSGMTISAAEFQTLVNEIGYRDLDDTPTETSRTVTITEIVDSGSNTAPNDNTTALSIASTVGVVATNDAPVFANVGPAVTFIENGSSVLIDGNITVTDPELEASANHYAGATLTIQRHSGPNADDAFAATGALDLVDVNGNGENVSLDGGMTFIGTYTDFGTGAIQFTFNADATAADISFVMQHIVYANASDNPPTSVQIDFTLDDGNGQPGGQPQGSGAGVTTASVVVNITQVDDAPVLLNVAPAAAYTVGSSGVVLSPSLVVFDVDATPPSTLTNIASATISIASGFFAGDEIFVNLPTSGGFFIIDNGTGPVVTNISVVSNAGGTLILGGQDTTQHYQNVLDAVRYHSTAADPSNGGANPSRTITWRVNDGLLDSQTPNTNPDNLVNTTLLHFDQPPVVDLDASGAGTGFTTTFTENGAPLAIADTDATIDDPDNAALDKLTITLTNAQAGDALSLAGALPIGIDSTIDTSIAGQITLRLINSASFADYETALAQVRFVNTSDNPSTVDRDITVVGSQGTTDSNIAHTTIHVIAVNDAPNALSEIATGNQNTTITGTVHATDPDGPSLTFTALTTPTHGAFTFNPATGAFSYTPDPTFAGNDSFTFKANDGIVDSNVATETLHVNPVTPNNSVWAGSPDLGVRLPPFQVAGVGDFNGNGTDDVLWHNPLTGQVDEWVMVNGQWSASIGLGTHSGKVAGIGDFNGDGTDDVLWRDPGTGAVDLWIMKNGQWSSSVSLGNHGVNWTVGAVGDFNGDGTDDIVWRNTTTGQVDEWVMKNGQWSSSISLGSRSTDFNIAGAGDFNHNGTDDILWHNATTGAVDEWQMDHGQWAGSIGLGARPDIAPQASPITHFVIEGIGDFNHDGTADVLWRNSLTGDVDAWNMFNGQWFSSSTLGPFDTHFDVAGIGNLNGAGGDDVLWRNPVSGQTSAWLLNSA